eukprot:gene8981-20821_t
MRRKGMRGQMNEFRRAICMRAYAILDVDGNHQITLDEIRSKYRKES